MGNRMRDRRTTAAALALLPLLCAGLAGCHRSASEDRAAIRENLEEKGPSAVVSEAARTADFKPPADGKLTDDQVETYLKVRRREKEILSVAAQDLSARPPAGAAGAGEGSEGSASGGSETQGAPAKPGTKVTVGEVTSPPREVAQLATADVRAAQELRVDPLEYQWIKGQVMQAQMALYTDNWAQLEPSGRDKMIESLHRMADVAGTPAERGEIDRRIAELSNPQAEQREVNQGLRANMQLVKDHQREILALERWPELAAAPAQPAAGGGSPGR
jgi:hypothetical protein